jgi:hypothetical protein
MYIGGTTQFMNRLERRKARKRERSKNKWNDKYSNCDLGCGGQMQWCTCCRMYTNICCVPYGTCQCS